MMRSVSPPYDLIRCALLDNALALRAINRDLALHEAERAYFGGRGEGARSALLARA